MNRRMVYTFKWPGSKTPDGLAMNCHMRNGQLRYFSTTRGHMIDGEVIQDDENGFSFRASRTFPGIWEFKVLTIEDFRRQVYRIVEDGGVIAQTIQTTEDLHEWYRKRFGDEAGLNYPDVLEE